MSIVAVASADELKDNKEFQAAFCQVWPALRIYLDDELRKASSNKDLSADALGHRLRAHFDIIESVEDLITTPGLAPQTFRAKRLNNIHQK